MEKIMQAVTLMAAACFVGSAVLLYGKFLGFDHSGLIWFVTFSDIVNHAPATMLVYGASVAAFIYYDAAVKHLTEIGSRWRYVGHGLVTLALIALFVFAQTSLTVVAISMLGLTMYSLAWRNELIGVVGRFGFFMIDGALWAFFTPLVFGYLWSRAELNSQWGVSVTVDGRPICAPASMSLDRGLILFRGDRYELIPWDNITNTRNVKKTGVAPKPNQKVGTCFGMV